jgi:predicted unusual protein kinase regulating ubiquinone biosynthesis (AarF/ABC1/UbiB family)
MIKFKENFKDINFVKVPKLYNKLSNNNIIVMEYVPSIKIDNLEELDKLNFNKKKISTKLIELFIMQVIDHGFVHIDPHPGNIGISMDGQIVFYDFGIILNIDKNIKENFNQLIIAIINKNINKICEISINMGLIIIEKEDIIYFKKFLISFLIYVENSNIEDFKINYIDKLSLNDTAWLGSKWKLFSYFNVQYGS